ncbi:NAD-dependent dehydratase [Methylopila musalis]|uniref:NAD-dependent dehydratase n=1 Tax=Methylopila musalis TaxID=1134781 RepID=A0ABW3Z3J1_9HYPH
MKLLIMGATGLVGGHVLTLALADPRIAAVTAPVRRPLPAHPKLSALIVDYENLPADAPFWSVDAVICALGTTIRKAGSRDAFRRIDHDHPLAVARLTHERGAEIFALNSALGADAGSRVFYSRVKGELERDLATVGFRSLTLVRPGLIGGERGESRPMERVASVVLGCLGPVLPRAWRINPAPRIASALLEAAVAARPGVRVVTSGELV